MTRRYEYLQEFLLGYFHPDWQMDSNSRSDVVDDFLNTADHALVLGAIQDLQDLLDEPLSEEALHSKVLAQYSLFYDPWQDGNTMREWLEALVQEVKRDQSE